MTTYRCPSCHLVFDVVDGKLRCPSCLRVHGLEEQAAGPAPKRARSSGRRLIWAVALLSLAAVLAGAGLLVWRRLTEVPGPGQLAVLDQALLRRTLIRRGVPAAETLSPFASGPAVAELARAAEGTSEADRARAVARRLAGTLGSVSPDLEGRETAPLRSPAELLAELKTGRARPVLSYELAALLTAALREAGLTALLGLAGRLESPMPTSSCLGGVGRYLALVYRKGQIGGGPVAAFDPMRALVLPAWAGGGRDQEMRSIATSPVALDDASAAAHGLALLAFRVRGRDVKRAYDLSANALRAGAGLRTASSQLHLLRALVLADAGGTEDAVREAQQAIAVRDDAPERTVLALLQVRAGRPSDGLQELERALKHDPAHFPALQQMATLLLGADPDRAEQHLKEALKVAPEEPSVQAAQALLHLQRGQPKEALDLLRQVVARRPTLDALLLLYQTLRLTNESDEAARVRGQILSLSAEQDQGSGQNGRKRLEQLLEAIDQAAAGPQSRESEPPSLLQPVPPGARSVSPRLGPLPKKLTLPDVRLGR